jgi:integrase
MPCRKREGSRGISWFYTLELGRDASGKRIQRTRRGFPTKKACEAERAAELVDRRRGTHIEPSTTPLSVYLERWLVETAGNHSGATHYAYQVIVRTRLVPALGTVPLGQLDALTLSRFYRSLSERYAATTVTATHTCLRAALKQAVRWRLIARAPTDDVTLAVGKAKLKTVWSAEEARRFLDKGSGGGGLRQSPHDTRPASPATVEAYAVQSTMPLFRFLLDSLCRLGEALALTWADLDLDAGIVTVNATRSIDREGKTRTRSGTKAGDGRRIRLTDETVHQLRLHRVLQIEQRLRIGPLWHDLDLVFERGDGRHWHPDSIRTALRRSCQATGVPVLTPHALRHTGATIAVAQGVPLHAVSMRLGHANISLTANLYAHASLEADHQVAEALRKALEG